MQDTFARACRPSQTNARGNWTASAWKAYELGWRFFHAWCRTQKRAALPASEETTLLFVDWFLSEGRQRYRMNVLAVSLAGIGRKHEDLGLSSPITPAVRARAHPKK